MFYKARFANSIGEAVLIGVSMHMQSMMQV